MTSKSSIRYQHIEDFQGLVISEASLSLLDFQPHFHLDFHIGLITNGVFRQTHKGQSMDFSQQHICFMPPGEVHDGRGVGNEPHQLTTFRVPPTLLQTALLDRYPDSLTPNIESLAPAVIHHGTLAQAFSKLSHALKPASQASQLYKDSLWTNVLAELFTLLGKTPKQEPQWGLSDQQLGQLRDYCDSHLEQKITLDELAHLTGLTRFQFIRHFQKRTGLAPHAWLLRLRLERACTQLKDTKNSLTDIAANVGFYDQSHFNRAFKKAYQIAPSRYRYGA